MQFVRDKPVGWLATVVPIRTARDPSQHLKLIAIECTALTNIEVDIFLIFPF